MKKHFLSIAATLILVTGFSICAVAEVDISMSGDLVNTAYTYVRKVNTPVTHNGGDMELAGRARILFEGYLNDFTSLRFEPEVIYTETFRTGSDSPSRADEHEGQIHEASVRFEEFILPSLDFTVGKQRITWGKADGMNPTDNFNPDNLSLMMGGGVMTLGSTSDLMDKPYVWGVRLENYFDNGIKVDFAWVPRVAASNFEVDDIQSYLPFQAGIGVTYPWKEDGWQSGDTSWGMRVSSTVGKMDFSLSYFRGYDDLPAIRSVNVDYSLALVAGGASMTEAMTGINSIEISYPRYEVIGMDFAGEKSSIGFWGEFAYYIPNDFAGAVYAQDPSISGSDTIIPIPIITENYVKYTLGMDYTFRIGEEGLYTNLQFAHGMYDERRYTPESRDMGIAYDKGMLSNLQNYIIYRLEYKFDNDEKTLAVMGFYEHGRVGSRDDNQGHMFIPYLNWEVEDDKDLAIGFIGFTGKEDRSKFGIYRGTLKGFINYKITW
ncbi:MAG TPA: hypothetical protein PLN69_09180 [bacterium]|mgnify:CR=1 FL=1|nr:hypothetical protein [bacterium]